MALFRQISSLAGTAGCIVDGVISGATMVIKTGTGTQTLSGANDVNELMDLYPQMAKDYVVTPTSDAAPAPAAIK